MRFGHLLSMTPAQRMAVLETQYPTGAREAFFGQCTPGEYERLLRGVPGALTQAWSNSMSPADAAAWRVYAQRTAKHQAREQGILDVLRPALKRELREHPYDLQALLSLPRLLGDPVHEKGVRLYFRREAMSTDAGVFERIFSVEELIPKLENLQRWGASPFVALHGIPYGVSRTNANVTHARVFSADWDAKHQQSPPLQMMMAYPPDLFVRSGGGYHAYWTLPEEEARELTLTGWRRVGLALCRALNADEDAVLGSQLMRLPGSMHLKNYAQPRPVYLLREREGLPRTDVVASLVRTYQLVLRDEDEYHASVATTTIDVDPTEHAALARMLEELEEQGLEPQRDRRGWVFFCPCHETATYDPGDAEEGEAPAYVPRSSSTPSGILRVNADQSLALFCGSTQKCGAGPREILERMGLHKDLAWIECGGFLQSDFGKRFKAARIADGTWNASRLPPISEATREAWEKMTGF